MSYSVIVDATHLSDFAFEPLPSGASAFDRVIQYVRRLPDVGTVAVFTDRPSLEVPPDWRHTHRPTFTASDLLEEMANALPAADTVSESVSAGDRNGGEVGIYIQGDTPFLDPVLTEKMLSNHERYYADVTFADGFPEGVAPLIISARILPTIRGLQDKHDFPLTRATVLDLIQKDINAFDVETELSPVDLRYLRLTLAADTVEGMELCRRFDRLNPRSVDDVTAIARDRGELLRVLPAYLSVQVAEREVQRLSYSPYPDMPGFTTEGGAVMPTTQFVGLLRRFASLNPNGVVGVSHWGEVATHPAPLELIDGAEEVGLRLLVETSGLHWAPEVLEELASRPRKQLTWIVGLDSIDPATYEEHRGQGFSEAMGFVDWALEHYPDNTYLQAVRLSQTETHLEEFYKKLKERTDNIIIQKYDHFCGVLPQRKVVDISPIVRRPCWHLKRDMVVLVDGTVPLCREDIDGRHVLGNAFEDDLEAIWSRGEELYLRHVREDYPELCEQCDEYYTFNF